jgi:PAS domain S-box-containing protein
MVTILDLILASGQPMFLAWGPERIWFYNDAFIPIAGHRHPASLGQPSSRVWVEAWADIEPMFDTVFSGQPVQGQDYKIGIDRGAAIEDAYFNYSLTPVRASGGSVVGLFGVCTETTSRVVGDRSRLATAVDERDRLFEMTRDLFGVASFDGMLKTINPAWSRQLERSDDFLLTHPFSEIIHSDDLAVTAGTVTALMAGRPVHQFHVRLLKQDGTAIPFAWSAVPDTKPGSNIFYTVGRDITEDLAAAADLKLAQDALRQAQKMESIGQLTGGIAHDFNNLLGGITGSLEMLQKRLGQGRVNEVDKYIVGAQGAAKRAAALTHRLLAFSRRQTLDPKYTDVMRLIEGMDELVSRTVGAHIRTAIIDGPDLWPVFIDQNQLENALLNLCINARDAMPDGGTIAIETKNQSFQDRAAKERHLAPGDYLSICVSDTGTGMAPDVLERAVDPFFTTKPLGQGTGLGLSMIYGFVRQSGGQVRIVSEVGKGTSISLYLPRYKGQSVEEAEVEQFATVQVQGKGTVLVIDDEPSIRMLAVEMLEDLGFRTLEAADGPTGLRLFNEHPEIKLLVTDVGLPGGMNGRQVADAARGIRPGLNVLFITGYAETAVWGENGTEKGMQVLTKPFSMDHLGQKVADLLD